jgi:hypothetical protein
MSTLFHVFIFLCCTQILSIFAAKILIARRKRAQRANEIEERFEATQWQSNLEA